MSLKQVTTPFDLEAAKAGKPVCTKWGLPVRIVCWDLKVKGSDLPVIGLVDVSGSESLLFYKENGEHPNREYDLRMAPEILTQWVNVLEVTESFGRFKKGDKITHLYGTKDEALSVSYPCTYWKCIVRAKRVDIEL
jgi:hypothetical protein